MISMKRARTVAVLIVVAALAATAPIQAESSGLADRVIEHKLANGMMVLMVERHQTPVVCINMTFGVGGVNEQVGQTGLAHLYEHMAFKGTRNIGTRDYVKEKAVLDELTRIGTELEQREREESARAQTEGKAPTFSPAVQQPRFKELQDQAGEYVVGQ